MRTPSVSSPEAIAYCLPTRALLPSKRCCVKSGANPSGLSRKRISRLLVANPTQAREPASTTPGGCSNHGVCGVPKEISLAQNAPYAHQDAQKRGLNAPMKTRPSWPPPYTHLVLCGHNEAACPALQVLRMCPEYTKLAVSAHTSWNRHPRRTVQVTGSPFKVIPAARSGPRRPERARYFAAPR